jgi:hypothetical protein
VKKTDLSTWGWREFPEFSKFKVYIPAKARVYEDDDSLGVSVMINPAEPVLGHLDDDRYLAQFKFIRMTKEKFEQLMVDALQSNAAKSNEATRKFFEWDSSFHPNIDRYEHRSYTTFRRDLLSSDGKHVLLIRAIAKNTWDEKPIFSAEDEATVRKIMNSVELHEESK